MNSLSIQQIIAWFFLSYIDFIYHSKKLNKKEYQNIDILNIFNSYSIHQFPHSHLWYQKWCLGQG